MRLSPAPPKGLLRRFVYAVARRHAGELQDSVAVMAHHRKLLLGWGAHEEMTARSKRVDEGRSRTTVEAGRAAGMKRRLSHRAAPSYGRGRGGVVPGGPPKP